MKHFLFLAIALITTSCTSLHVKTVIVTPEPHSVAIAPEQLPSPVKEESSAPRVEQVLTFEAPTDTTEIAVSETELKCLQDAIYHEARGEGSVGMAAVGYVVTNRVASKQFKPKTVCGIIYQGFTRNGKQYCQFSWTCDRHSDKASEKAAYERCRVVAQQVLKRQIANPIGKSTYYFETAIKRAPKWAYKFTYHTRIGRHKFYIA